MAIVVLIAAVGALATPASSSAAFFFLLDDTHAAPNERVTVRTGSTPPTLFARQLAKPFGRPIRLYVLKTDTAAAVRSRFDSRVHFVGSLVPDRRGRGILTFSVPPLDAGTYTLAFWCPACAPHSRGRSFFVQDVAQFAQRYRSRALLQIEKAIGCPVTRPNGEKPPKEPRGLPWHGNGLLWTRLSRDGIDAVAPSRVRADGSIRDELLWTTSLPGRALLTVSGQRLDARGPPLRVLTARRRSSSSGTTRLWATAVVFPAPGCWRITARIADIRLTYVVKVLSPSRSHARSTAGCVGQPRAPGRLATTGWTGRSLTPPTSSHAQALTRRPTFPA
jgi:hypothetical protein